MQNSPRPRTGKALLTILGPGLALAAVILTAACSAAARPAATGTPRSPGTAPRPTPATVAQPVPSTVEHWGSFFGAVKGINYDTEASPVTVTLPGPVAEVSSSNSTEYALLTDGTLYAWGLGTRGQLGDGNWDNSFTRPVRVRFPAGVKIASIPTDVMPYDTALAVDTQGRAWGWGANGGGELCLGSKRSYPVPVQLPLSHVTALAGASNHAQYDAGGTVYACGQNLDGDLGDGSNHGSTTPVLVKDLDGSSVVKLVASFASSGALLANGTYYDWGINTAGQLGDGHLGGSSRVPVRVNLPHPVTLVAQGGSIWANGQSLVLLSDGSLWAWGDDWAGQLGDKGTKAQASPVRIHAPTGVTYQRLATGSATSYAVAADGDVYAWGASPVGQLGDGHMHTSMTPVLVASGATGISSTANNVVISVPQTP